METFEEYLHNQKIELWGTRIKLSDAHKAWNYQQSKLDLLTKCISDQCGKTNNGFTQPICFACENKKRLEE